MNEQREKQLIDFLQRDISDEKFSLEEYKLFCDLLIERIGKLSKKELWKKITKEK